MNAVYSFFTRPYLHYGGMVHGKVSNKSFELAWMLSVNYARRYFDKVNLVTDSVGKEILSGLCLPFNEISTELDNLPDHLLPEMWAAGKIRTYELQEEPFVHIDYDVFLLENPYVIESGLVCQSVETFQDFPSYIPLVDLMVQAGYNSEVWLFNALRELRYAYNCGVFGGNDLKFIKAYCKEAWIMINYVCAHPELLDKLGKKERAMFPILFEQYLLAACTEIQNKKMDVIVESYCNNKGYIHLMGAKSWPDVIEKMKNRLRRDFPGIYYQWIQRTN